MAFAAAQLAFGPPLVVKVAIVCPYALNFPGGVQAQAIGLAETLTALGHEARLVGPGDGVGNGACDVGPAIKVRVNQSVAPIALDPRSGRRALQTIAGADVVHIHEPFAPFLSLGVLVEGEPPKVGTFHVAPGWEVSLIYRTATPLLRRLARRLAVATAVSPVAAAAVDSIADKVRIIPIGFDFDFYQIAMPRRPQRVVFLGRDEPRKGLNTLLSAWERVARELPNAELMILGVSRPDTILNKRYLGRVSDEVKRRELAQAAILCAPNTGYESFGTVLLEGMAAGCAVVASRLPAFEAVVGEGGVFFSPGDERGLSDCLLSLLRDPERAAELGARARERSRQCSWARVFPAYLEAYREAIEQGSHRSRS